MPIKASQDAPRSGTAIPFIFLVLAATAIPIELRAIGKANVDFSFEDVGDILANIIGYLPLGMAGAGLGFAKAVLLCGLLSVVAETSQLVMLHRDPSLVDVFANVAGAALGYLVSSRYGIRLDSIRITRAKAAIAAVLILAIILRVIEWKGDPVSDRGVTKPGTVEAFWKLEDTSGRSVVDSSEHQLKGSFRRDAPRINDLARVAPVFDGKNYIEIGHATELRLAGSMTITARIRSSSYPFDDAAILSQRRGDLGYQLDTTIDTGIRTIGFKLTNACGETMTRYGTSSLDLDTWYHVAGVYNAQNRTMDVYLNGELNNGLLAGTITSAQRSSREDAYIAKRPGSNKYNFSGSLENVRVYSFALSKPQVEADMREDPVQNREPASSVTSQAGSPACGSSSDENDKELPAAAALLGVLGAIAVLGVKPTAGRRTILLASFAAGLLLLPFKGPDLPAFNDWTLPLTSIVGGLCVAVSVRRGD